MNIKYKYIFASNQTLQKTRQNIQTFNIKFNQINLKHYNTIYLYQNKLLITKVYSIYVPAVYA